MKKDNRFGFILPKIPKRKKDCRLTLEEMQSMREGKKRFKDLKKERKMNRKQKRNKK